MPFDKLSIFLSTSSPNFSFIKIDSGPPHFVETTGNPQLLASIITTPNVSYSLDNTNAS